jgi:multidrug efflux system outer membrane protein
MSSARLAILMSWSALVFGYREKKRSREKREWGLSRRELAMTSKRTLPAVALLLGLCACKVGPNYKRPMLSVPDQYRDVAPEQAGGEQFGDMKWWAIFQDETLQGLIKEALINNYDLRIAATRVLEANANLGITRANQLPSLGGSVGISNARNQLIPNSTTFETAGLSLSYIVDFWG